MSNPFQRREGQYDMVAICHPSFKHRAEEWLSDVNEQIEGPALGLVTEEQCPPGKAYIVNRDYYDAFSEQPWKTFGHVE